jgi:tetratricopeptide (TPR) repeat protein
MKRQRKRPANESAEPRALSCGKPGVDDGENVKESQGILEFLPSWWRRDWLLGFFLVVLTIIAYQPAWHGGLIWDDDGHITAPRLRSLNGLARIWTQPGATQQYYPLVHSVFWAEHKLWGEATTGYHCLNILLHAFSALLLVKILRQLNIPGAWLAAALFALHPVEVESVAWISELKNTLSAVFYLSAALTYLGFDRNRNWPNYAIALGLFLLGLMSKTAIATLPAALLVVFWWQRGKVSWKRDVPPLIPFFLAGIGAGLFTAWMERTFIGAEGSEFNFSIVQRFLIAGRAIWFYLGKLFWPVDLAFMYPRWNVSQTAGWQYLFPAAALLLLTVLVWQRWRGPLAGLLFFVGTLFPALGFFNVYPFRFSFVADHFQYLASLGPLTLAAAGITAGLGFFRKGRPLLEAMLCATLLLVLGTLTWKQCRMYANAETLWQTTLPLNPNSSMVHNSLGSVFFQQGRLSDAISQFQEALEIKPDSADAHNNLGTCLFFQGRMNEAITHYQKAVEIKPDFAHAHRNLGLAFCRQGRMEEGISQCQKALEIKPADPELQNDLAWLLATGPDGALRDGNRAVELARQANALTGGDNPIFLHTLAAGFAETGRFTEAMETAQRALRLAEAQSKTKLAMQLKLEMKLYQAGSPYHIPAQTQSQLRSEGN